MSVDGRISPALLRRAFFFFGVLIGLGAPLVAAPAPKAPELAQVGKPDAAEAARLIEQFRNSGIPGEFYLEFELRALPRRGEEKTFNGRWWGSRNEQGIITRIELIDAAGTTHRLLLQNGEHAMIWRWENGRVAEVGSADVMAPLVPGVEVSAFDLQMPYLYWPGATVEKITRILQRPAHAFIFPAPAAFKAQHPEVGAARAYLDTQFNVPMQTEIIDRNGRVTKTLALLSLKTVDKQTLPKAADYRNEVTRDKTRLQFTAVALNLQLPASVFQPANLAEPAAPPAASRLVRIDP